MEIYHGKGTPWNKWFTSWMGHKRGGGRNSPAVSQGATQCLQLSQGLHLLQVFTAHNTVALGVHSAGVQQPVLSAFWVWELLGRCLQELGETDLGAGARGRQGL